MKTLFAVILLLLAMALPAFGASCYIYHGPTCDPVPGSMRMNITRDVIEVQEEFLCAGHDLKLVRLVHAIRPYGITGAQIKFLYNYEMGKEWGPLDFTLVCIPGDEWP